MIDARFIRRVVPDIPAGPYSYVGVWFRDAVKDIVWGRAFSDKQAALNFANSMVGRAVDVFFGMSLQSATKPAKKNARGRTVLPAEKLADLAVLLRAFWLDIDLKGGYFKDTQQALKEVGEWRRAAGLPMPSLVVMTGSGGFHLYWILDQPISRAMWEPLAWALRTAATMYFKPRPNPKGGRDLTLDFGLTTDAGRILRAPGSLNHKTNPPNPVFIAHEDRDYTLAEWDTALAPHKVANYAPSVITPRTTMRLTGKPSAVFDGVQLPGPLDAGIDETSYVPTLEEVIDGGCDFLKAAHATGGAGQSQTLWFTMLGAVYFMKDALEVAHELSDGWVKYDGTDSYNPAEVDKKFSEIVDSRANQRIGWTRCQTLKDAGATECTTCRHWPPSFDKQSPLHFALPKAVVTTVAAAAIASSPVATAHVVPTTVPAKINWPSGYKQDPDGIVYTMLEDPRDPDKPAVRANIMPYPLLNIWVQRPGDDDGGEWALNMQVETTKTSKPVVDAQFTYEELYDQRKLGSSFGRQGIGLFRHQLKLTADFMVSFVQLLQQSTANRIEESVASGWVRRDGKRCAFVYGGMYNSNGATRSIVPRDRNLHELYSPHGTLDEWKKACRLLTDQKRPAANAVLAASFAAPLVGAAGYTGCVMAVKGESGIGKSHALRVGLSAWAHPTLAMGRWDDTANNVDTRLGENPHTPHMFDEVKDEVKARKLTDQIMMLGQGKTKGRNSRLSKTMPVMAWNTMMVLGSNTSIADLMDEHVNMTVAGINRVFEFLMPPNQSNLGLIERTKAEIIIRELDANYGHAGAIYAGFLGKDPEYVGDCVARTAEAVDKAVQGGKDDRFHIATITVSLVGARFANNLGLTDIDIDQLGGFLIEQLQEQRNRRGASRADMSKESNVLRFVEDYLSQRQEFTLVTDHIWRSTNRPPQGWSAGNVSRTDLRGVFVHAARLDNVVRISLSDFRAYLKRNDVNSASVIGHIVQIPAASRGKSYLGLGTMYRDPNRQDVLELDLSKAPGVFSFT